jgi:hypothetical protein
MAADGERRAVFDRGSLLPELLDFGYVLQSIRAYHITVIASNAED